VKVINNSAGKIVKKNEKQIPPFFDLSSFF